MKLLIVEDESMLAQSISDCFSGEGYICEIAVTYAEGLEKIMQYEYDCILLDVMLPGGSGITLLEEIRSLQKPAGVIIISARNALEDKVSGLKTGADDYLTKPFHLSELSARVYSVIRRKKFESVNVIKEAEVEIDLLAKTVHVHDRHVVLTKKEFDLLLFLVSNRNWVSSKSALAEHLSGDTADMFSNHDYVYAHIKNLKRKLSEAGCADHIKTVYGMGYKWET